MSGSSHRSKCTAIAGSKEASAIALDRLDADPRPFTAGPDAAAGLAEAIRGCRICVTAPRGPALPHAPKPVLRLSGAARLVIASQAPGIRAHASGVPFDDPSGERLRAWMGIGPDLFYDPERVIIAPMGFCFPGHDAHKGDRPPRPECRAAWHDQVFAAMPQVETILAIGHHAIRYHMDRLCPDLARGLGLSDQVKAWRCLFERPGLPRLMPMPHPSWRNSGWLKRNPWFETELLPVVRAEVRRLVG
jgi:uracil-DNA glycosylase